MKKNFKVVQIWKNRIVNLVTINKCDSNQILANNNILNPSGNDKYNHESDLDLIELVKDVAANESNPLMFSNITLRDWFAGQALTSGSRSSQEAYLVADRMLEQRNNS